MSISKREPPFILGSGNIEAANRDTGKPGVPTERERRHVQNQAAPKPRRGVLLEIGAVVLFGYSGVVAIDLLDHHSSAELAQRSLLIAAVALWGVVIRKKIAHPEGRIWALAALGGCSAASFVLFFVALGRLGAGPAMTLQFVAVLTVLIWTRVVRGVRVPGVAWVATLITMLGMSLAVDAWVWEKVDLIGILSGVGAAVLVGIYLLMVDHLGNRLAPLTISAYATGVAALLVLPISGLGPTDISLSRWWLLLVLGLVGSALPMVMEVTAVRHAGPGPVGMIVLTQPVVGGVLAWVILGQTLISTQILGIGVSLVGVLLVQVKVVSPT